MSCKTTVFGVVLLVIVLAIGGWVWYEEKPVANNENDKEEAVEEPSDISQIWYSIPELGIKVELPKDIANDLVYEYKERPSQKWKGNNQKIFEGVTKSASFSTKTLMSIDKENCSPGEYSPVGVIAREEGQQSDYGELYSSWSGIIPFDGFFIYYQSPQSPCTINKEYYDHMSLIIGALNRIFHPEYFGIDTGERYRYIRILQP